TACLLRLVPLSSSPTRPLLVPHSFPTRRSSDLRRPYQSLNLISSSTVFQQDHNGYTHQDPGIITLVAEKKPEFTRVYLPADTNRSEEHTSELQSRFDLVCRLLLEKKNTHE